MENNLKKHIKPIIKNFRTMELKINERKIKLMELLESQTKSIEIYNYIFDRVDYFKYLGVYLIHSGYSNRNYFRTQISGKKNKNMSH